MKSLLSATAILSILVCSCNQPAAPKKYASVEDSLLHCSSNLPARYAVAASDTSFSSAADSTSHEGMVWIAGGEFMMGANDDEGREDEYPQHRVKVSGFWMDATEVTNAQFKNFVDATGYITTAEIAPDWEEIKKQVPAGTPRPPDSVLVAASLVFVKQAPGTGLGDPSQWWDWKKGAS